jgi:hypothetical protein
MLEYPTLRLERWTAATCLPCLVISEPASRRPLGLARWRPRPGPFWRRWLTPSVLEILESEDESLLCTVQRTWGLRPGWDVFDADARFVGSIHGAYVLDPFGRALAIFVTSAAADRKSFVDSSQRELGTLLQEERGNCLSFGAALPDNPFARMLLLATVLVS